MSATESQSTTGKVKQKAQAAAHTAAETIKSKAGDVASRARDTAAEMADERRSDVADRIESIGSALNQTADSVETEDPNIAWLTHQASQRLQNAAAYVRGASWQSLRDDGTALARRHPVAFYGGMFALGAAAGALIKAGVKSGARSAEDEISQSITSPQEGYTEPQPDQAQTGAPSF